MTNKTVHDTETATGTTFNDLVEWMIEISDIANKLQANMPRTIQPTKQYMETVIRQVTIINRMSTRILEDAEELRKLY